MPVLPPNPRLSDFLRPFPPRVVHLAMKLREFVLEEAAGATELVYDAYNAVALGYTFNGRPKGSFVHIAVYANHVNLGFNQGTDLPDPRGLLKGSGKCIRPMSPSRTSLI